MPRHGRPAMPGCHKRMKQQVISKTAVQTNTRIRGDRWAKAGGAHVGKRKKRGDTHIHTKTNGKFKREKRRWRVRRKGRGRENKVTSRREPERSRGRKKDRESRKKEKEGNNTKAGN